MTDAGFFRGTSADQDNRFADKQKKLLKEMNFSPVLNTKLKMSKIDTDRLKPWIDSRIKEVLENDDELMSQSIYEHLAEKEPDGKNILILLTGFVDVDKATKFMEELWTKLIETQESSNGVALVPTDEIEHVSEEHESRSRSPRKGQSLYRTRGYRPPSNFYNERRRPYTPPLRRRPPSPWGRRRYSPRSPPWRNRSPSYSPKRRRSPSPHYRRRSRSRSPLPRLVNRDLHSSRHRQPLVHKDGPSSLDHDGRDRTDGPLLLVQQPGVGIPRAAEPATSQSLLHSHSKPTSPKEYSPESSKRKHKKDKGHRKHKKSKKHRSASPDRRKHKKHKKHKKSKKHKLH